MLQTQKITKDLVAVSHDPTEILIRKSGKVYFRTEKVLVHFDGNKLVINKNVAEEFGIHILLED